MSEIQGLIDALKNPRNWEIEFLPDYSEPYEFVKVNGFEFSGVDVVEALYACDSHIISAVLRAALVNRMSQVVADKEAVNA